MYCAHLCTRVHAIATASCVDSRRESRYPPCIAYKQPSIDTASLLQCVAVCCSVLQCVAVCCSVLQCVAVCCSVLQCAAVCCSVLLVYHGKKSPNVNAKEAYIAKQPYIPYIDTASVLQCVAVCGKCVAVCCSV